MTSTTVCLIYRLLKFIDTVPSTQRARRSITTGSVEQKPVLYGAVASQQTNRIARNTKTDTIRTIIGRKTPRFVK